MKMDKSKDKYDPNTGKPLNKEYLECGLPEYLVESIKLMADSWERIGRGETDLHWDIYYCNLQADINCAEVDGEISSEAAWYLREKYLGMRKKDNT